MRVLPKGTHHNTHLHMQYIKQLITACLYTDFISHFIIYSLSTGLHIDQIINVARQELSMECELLYEFVCQTIYNIYIMRETK